jgi:hypothetical protein
MERKDEMCVAATSRAVSAADLLGKVTRNEVVEGEGPFGIAGGKGWSSAVTVVSER